MGMFDSLYAELECPDKHVKREVEIQFKWSDCLLDDYRIGDQLKFGPYGNIWIPEDYLCDLCSSMVKHELGWQYENAVHHGVFIHLNNGKFVDVLPKRDFTDRFVKDGTPTLPPGEYLHMNFVHYDRLPDFFRQRNQNESPVSNGQA